MTAARGKIGTALRPVRDWLRGTTIAGVLVCVAPPGSLPRARFIVQVYPTSEDAADLTPLMARRLASALEAAATEAERRNGDAW